MADLYWWGSVSKPASTAGNWSTSPDSLVSSGAPPGVSDIAHFNKNGTQECEWDIAAVSEIVYDTMYEEFVETSTGSDLLTPQKFSHGIKFTIGTVALQGLTLDGELSTTASTVIVFVTAPITAYQNRWVLNLSSDADPGDDITYSFGDASISSEVIYFDTGKYPNLMLTNCVFKPQYGPGGWSDTSNKETVDIYQLVIASGTFAPTTSTSKFDRRMIFKIRSEAANPLAIAIKEFLTGFTTWQFTSSSTGFSIPVSGNSTYGGVFDSQFKSQLYGIEILKGSAGNPPKATIPQGLKLTCSSLKIHAGAFLEGGIGDVGYSEIELISMPDIEGSWNFTQMSDGSYRAISGGVVYVDRKCVASFGLSTSVVSFTSGAYTIAPLDTILWDSADGWDAGNYWYEIPYSGKYEIKASSSVRYLSSAQLCITAVRRDTGSGFSDLFKGAYAYDSGNQSQCSNISFLKAGDKIALYVYHNGSSGKNLIGDAVILNATKLQITRVE